MWTLCHIGVLFLLGAVTDETDADVSNNLAEIGSGNGADSLLPLRPLRGCELGLWPKR